MIGANAGLPSGALPKLARGPRSITFDNTVISSVIASYSDIPGGVKISAGSAGPSTHRIVITGPAELHYFAIVLAGGSGLATITGRLIIDGVLLASPSRGVTLAPEGRVVWPGIAGPLYSKSTIILECATEDVGYAPGIAYSAVLLEG